MEAVARASAERGDACGDGAPARRHAARARQTAAGEPRPGNLECDRGAEKQVRRRPNGRWGRTPAASRAAVRPRDRMLQRWTSSMRDRRLRREPPRGPCVFKASAAEESRVTAGSVDGAGAGAVDPIPFITASHATAILSERMRASNTLEAFCSVVCTLRRAGRSSALRFDRCGWPHAAGRATRNQCAALRSRL